MKETQPEALTKLLNSPPTPRFPVGRMLFFKEKPAVGLEPLHSEDDNTTVPKEIEQAIQNEEMQLLAEDPELGF